MCFFLPNFDELLLEDAYFFSFSRDCLSSPRKKFRSREECKSSKYIWFSLFFSPGAPRRLQTTHRPENPISLLENRPFYKRMSSYLLFQSTKPAKSVKIGPRWLGKIPNVDPTLTERQALVAPGAPWRPYVGG